MEEHLRQEQDLRQVAGLTPQQVQFVRLLEMNAQEVEEAAAKELDANPALAVEDSPLPEAAPLSPFRHRLTDDQLRMREQMFDRQTGTETLFDALNAQLGQLSLPENVEKGARYIIGSLDNDGYLRRPLPSIANELAINEGINLSEEDINEAFGILRTLEPRGVGATDLQDCLQLQLDALPPSPRRELALKIVSDYFPELSKHHISAIRSATRSTHEAVTNAVELIQSLNPKPGSEFASSGMRDTATTIIPDFIVEKTDGKILLTLNNYLPELTLSESFVYADRQLAKAAAERRGKNDKDLVVTRNLNEARSFIENIRRRQTTLFEVMTALIRLQHDYFETEDNRDIRPMTLRDLAEAAGYDVSTISRATANKYVALPHGILPLRHFFSEKFKKDSDDDKGEQVSARHIETEIKDIVDAEDSRHPLSDDAITRRLREKGYDVSRRTVNKYRERLGIKVARLRKKG